MHATYILQHENQWEKPNPRNETHCQSVSTKEHLDYRHKEVIDCAN